MIAVHWNLFGAFGIAAAVLIGVMAWFVWATRPDRAQNRRLAFFLVLSGLSAGFYFGAAILGGNEATATAAIALGITFLIPAPAAYLYFLATIPSPLSKPLQIRPASWLFVAYVLVIETVWLLEPEFFYGSHLAFYGDVGGWHVDVQQPLLGIRALGAGVLAVAELYGLAVAVTAYFRATTEVGRQQAAAFAIAFGTRDVFGAAFVVYFGAINGVALPGGEVLFIMTLPAVDLLFCALLTYGILRNQLFDIHLRLKGALRHAAVAAPFALAFFVVSEALESVVPAESFWLGLLAAGSIVLVLRPIQAFAAGLADRLMPGVEASPEYLRARKQEVYGHAVEAILEDGVITDRERKVLDRLCRDLQISTMDARRIEAVAAR